MTCHMSRVAEILASRKQISVVVRVVFLHSRLIARSRFERKRNLRTLTPPNP